MPDRGRAGGVRQRRGADLVLSLHADANHSMHAQGLATFHFGNGSGITSTVGEALAGFIHRELLSRTAMLDSAPRPARGSCCGSPACPPCGWRWAT